MIHKNYCNIIMINGNLTSAPVFSTWVVVGGGVQYKQRDNRNFIVHQAYIVYPLNKYPPGLLYQLPCCCIRCPQYDIQAPLLFCGPSMRHDLYHNSMYPTYHPLLTCSKVNTALPHQVPLVSAAEPYLATALISNCVS